MKATKVSTDRDTIVIVPPSMNHLSSFVNGISLVRDLLACEINAHDSSEKPAPVRKYPNIRGIPTVIITISVVRCSLKLYVCSTQVAHSHIG